MATVEAAFYGAVNELMTRNSPPKLGGGLARTKSEQAGWFPCRYWQLREPPRPRLRSGTPPNLGGSGRTPIHSQLHRPPLQRESPTSSTFCAKPALSLWERAG